MASYVLFFCFFDIVKCFCTSCDQCCTKKCPIFTFTFCCLCVYVQYELLREFIDSSLGRMKLTYKFRKFHRRDLQAEHSKELLVASLLLHCISR